MQIINLYPKKNIKALHVCTEANNIIRSTKNQRAPIYIYYRNRFLALLIKKKKIIALYLS